MNVLKIILPLFFLGTTLQLRCQQRTADTLSVFSTADYPDSLYHIYHKKYKFGTFRIFLTNLGPVNYNSCRSFVLITKGLDTLYRKCFPEINALGGSSGVFSSDSNGFKDYFFISKFGDYDGHLIILSKAGKITEISGSSFYISKDHAFLFADQDRDIGGLTIWDLTKNRSLYDSEEQFIKGNFTVGERFLWRLCYDKDYHYLVYLKDMENASDPKLFVLKFDNHKGTLKQETMEAKYLLSLPELSIKNSYGCSCCEPDKH